MADVDEQLRRCERFVYHEAELLDRGDLEGWLELLADDAVYWMPLDTARHEPRGALNLIYDDRRRLEDRVGRLRSGFTHTEDPPARLSHLIGNLRLLDAEEARRVVSWVSLGEADVVLGARVIVARSRRGHTEVFHGRVVWVLRSCGGRFTIRVKRIDLLDADQPLPTITSIL